jgi:hypothetical protein
MAGIFEAKIKPALFMGKPTEEKPLRARQSAFAKSSRFNVQGSRGARPAFR